MLPAVRAFETAQLKADIPSFKTGDSLRVHIRIVEGERSRVQVFEGVCIARSGGGARETITVRRTSYGLGMERIFPLHSPTVEKIEVVRRGRVRRAKLYYLRGLRGKKARITEASREAIRKIERAGLAAAVAIEPELEPEEERAPEEPTAEEPVEDEVPADDEQAEAPAEETPDEADKE